MNTPLSDGNEPVIDIFILSANSPLSTQLEKQLRDEGYSVTLFSDGTHLLETLRNGKPNLLMCDATSAGADAFEVCRQIKADEYLWNIPLLIITGASDLGDLLRVLDCNADNFIAHPFDPPYLLSLIEGMLTIPVERQTPEQIKTQFKIKHDDQVFVVTADRRKLLEFLLSSFEIAVNKSADLSRAQEDNRNQGFAIRKMEETVHENTKVIGIINETLKTKEQKLAELTGLLSDREQTIREKIAATDELSRDLSTVKSAHTEAQSEIQRIELEKDESLAAHQATIDQLGQQVSGLSSELALLKPALERANEELLKESGQRKDAENELSTTATHKAHVEKALLALNTEYEQLKIDFGTEKNRAQETEQNLNAVLLAKTQSEQDLTGIINDLKATAQEQAAALIRFKEESASERGRIQEELESERARLRHTEENLNAVTAEKEQSEASLRETIDAGQKDLLSLQARLDTAGSQLEEKEQTIKTLTDELAAVRSTKESMEQELASVSRAHADTKTVLDGRQKDLLDVQARFDSTRPLLAEAEHAIKTLSSELATVRFAKESAEQELASVSRAHAETKTALESETRNLTSQKEDLARVYAEKEKAETLAAESLSASLKELQDQLGLEKSRYRDSEERMNMIILQRDRELGELRQIHEDSRTAVTLHKTQLEQMKQELDSAVSARTEAEEKLHLAEEKIQKTGQDLASTSEGREKEKQQLTTLADELERVKTSLEQETVRRQESEDQLREALSREQQQEQELERFVSETKTLHADMIAERRMHEAAKEQNRSLEAQVTALNREKSEAEKAAAGLTAEIDQARVALADEWEDHMTDYEHLVAGTGKKQQSGPVPSSGMRKEAEIIKKRSLIVKVPAVPSVIHPLSRTMVAINPVKAPSPEASHINSVEDLFEDDENDKKKPAGAPVVSIIEEPVTEPIKGVLPDSMTGRSDRQESFFEDRGSSTPGTREDVGGDDTDDDDNSPLDTSGAAPVAGQNVAFNRAQWLDLLRWSHHCEGLTQDQRMQIVRLGRLIQKGRKLTNNQELQVLDMLALVRKLGYRIS
jgi:DNA-binding response OmpR family regulator